MKKILIAFLCLWAITATAQADFNYEFYPAPKYTKFRTFNNVDSTTKKITVASDTSASEINIIVEKRGSQFTIRYLGNVSETVYDKSVHFVGIDTNGNLAYKANTPEAEVLFVNPIRGVVEIVYQKCFDNGLEKPNDDQKLCNIVRHIFGNIDPPKSVEPKK